MANQKISDLPAASSVADADLATVVQSGTNKKSALSVIKTYITSALAAVYAPLSRALSIGGTSKTLAADRSWTTSEILDGIGTPVHGDVLIRSTSNWINLGAGTDGQVLTTHSTTLNPTWETPTTGAPTTAHYVTTQTESGLSNEFSLGSLGAGLLKQTVSTGVATPAVITIPGDGTKFLDGTGSFVSIPGSGSGVSQLISGGGVAWTGTGFNYIISAATYTINGTQFSSAQTPVTLSAADATQDRIDVFYVDSTGTAGVITGTPGTPPVHPSIDPGTQLELTFAYVVAASSTPVITNVNIYLENTEYTMSTNSAGTINLASTNNPFAGTKDIEGTATVNGNLFTGVKPSGTLDLSLYTQLTFQLRSKAAWPSAKSISIFWMNGTTTVVGVSQAVKDGTFGFNSSNTSSYQQIVIPIANFGTGTSAVDRLRMTVSGGGSAIGWYIDNIILQAGGGGGGGGGTVTNFSAGALSPLFTTTVTTPTSTPALSFVLTAAGANTYLGNATGGSLAPSYTAAGSLTKTDDTNVTLTLGGNPTTSLLRATSLTLGWTGTLSVARGGSGAGTLTGVLIGNGTSAFTTVTAPAGTIVGTSDTQTLTNKRVNPRVTSIASNATWSPSADTDDVYEVTAQAAAATTISNPSGTPVDGQKLIFRIKDNGTARALTWSGSQWRASSDLALPTTTILSKTLYLGFIYNSADTKWDLLALLNNF